ncbi:urease accessory protein UreD [Patulibacter sp. NPDC049589]|uniref:urease accessory protein UreD n=1 Tax=Patulibacter sp. NPDC049589 TaxID=3154731 RepID=UPI00342C4543
MVAPPRAPGPATTTHRHGRLDVTLERRGPATVVAAQDIVFPSGTVRIADVDGDGVGELQITNPSGGLLAGDRMDTLLRARAGTRASVVTQGANRVCGAAVGLPPARTELHARMALEGDAVLEWAPHHLVPYARAAILQRTAVEVAPAAGLLLWETLSAGRSGRGERFAWDHVDVRMRVARDGRPLLHDGAVLGPGGEPFDGADLVATVVVVLPTDRPAGTATDLADDLHRALGAVPGTLASASAVDDALIVGRVVARDATVLYRALHAARVLARPALGLPAPRRPIT